MCAFLLNLLNQQLKTNFLISDAHSNITSCALPEWLPGDFHSMVVEFGRRLRKELRELQNTNEQRLRENMLDDPSENLQA